MIQRIQTVFLALSVLAWVLVLFLPIAIFGIGGETYPYLVSKLTPQAGPLADAIEGMNGVLLFLMAIFSIALTILSITKYKKRLVQIKLGKSNLMIHLVFIVVAFFLIDGIKSTLMPESFKYGIGMVFPLVSVVLQVLASKAIAKDEKMVRAADRIR